MVTNDPRVPRTAPPPGRLPAGGERFFWSALAYAIGLGVTALFVVPLIWMISTSLRPAGLAAPTQFEWVPPAFALDNYTTIFGLIAVEQQLRNSLLVMAAAVPLTLLSATLGGFALSQVGPRSQGVITAVAVAALMVPRMALWVTLFLVYKQLHILNTPLALIAPAVMGTSPLYVLMFAWAFRRVPSEVYEQARLDGAGALRIWWHIGLPLVRPVAGAVIVLSTEFYWSDFISPLLYITDQQWYTLPLGVRILQQMDKTNWPLLMAGAVLLTLPVLITFLLAQRFYFREDRGAGWLGR